MLNKIRIGMVGGGPGSGIGPVHREALELDDEYELVAGCFSRDYQKSILFGKELGLNENRIYPTYQNMFQQESSLPENERINAVIIATPNNFHFEAAKLALLNNFHVMLEKPITCNLQEARELNEVAKNSNTLCCVNYTYTGYPMVKEAKVKIAEGDIGKIRMIEVKYHQGWLSADTSVWRTDPSKSGIGGAISDIGSHAFNLAEYMTGLQITDVCAILKSFVTGRKLDDAAALLLKFDNEATGVLTASQVSVGNDNNLLIRIYGEKGSIAWDLSNPSALCVDHLNKPEEIWRAGIDNVLLHEKTLSQLVKPPSADNQHVNAMANHYHNFAKAIKSKETKDDKYYPTLEEGVRGMELITATVLSNKSEKKWLNLKYDLNENLDNKQYKVLSMFR